MADLVSRPSTEVDWDKELAPIRRQAQELAEQARKQPDEPGDKRAALPLPAFEPDPAVRQFAHDLRELARDIYKADRLRAGAAADAREASGAAHDPTIYNADMERAVSDRAAREHATYRYEMAPVPDRRVIDEAFGDLARNIPTPEQRVRNTNVGAFEPDDSVRQFAHDLRELARDIYKADRLRAGAAADAREASGAGHDPTIYNADMERAVSDRAAREHATYRYELAPVPDRRVIDEAFGDLARNIPTPEQRVRNTMDVSTAKAEVAQGKQDLRAARQERADGDLLQQTLTIGRQVEAARKAEQPAEQKAETKGRSMRV